MAWRVCKTVLWILVLAGAAMGCYLFFAPPHLPDEAIVSAVREVWGAACIDNLTVTQTREGVVFQLYESVEHSCPPAYFAWKGRAHFTWMVHRTRRVVANGRTYAQAQMWICYDAYRTEGEAGYVDWESQRVFYRGDAFAEDALMERAWKVYAGQEGRTEEGFDLVRPRMVG